MECGLQAVLLATALLMGRPNGGASAANEPGVVRSRSPGLGSCPLLRPHESGGCKWLRSQPNLRGGCMTVDVMAKGPNGKRLVKNLVDPGAGEENGVASTEGDEELDGQYVVPAEATLLEALAPAMGEYDDFNHPLSPACYTCVSITITGGVYNLTEAGEVPLCRRVHLAAATGVQLLAYALPRPQHSFAPTHGGGRLRFMEGATGSTLSGVVMHSRQIQCAIISAAAVLFDGCELRVDHGDEDCSVLWIADTGHATVTRCDLGGMTPEEPASQAIVIDGPAAEAVIVNSVLENCWGSTVALCNNGTARMSACWLRDSFSAFAVVDESVHEGPRVGAARIELYHSTVQCVTDLWRDECSAAHFVERNTSILPYAFKDLAAHDIDGRENRTIEPKMKWDPDRSAFRYAGMTSQRRYYLKNYYETHRINGTVDPLQVYADVTRKKGLRPWESSEEHEHENRGADQGSRALVDLERNAYQDSSEDETALRRKQRTGRKISVDTRHRSALSGGYSTSVRYKSETGHPGNPPVPKNKYFGGVQKTHGTRKGRHTYKRT